jgi:hypothetical protein
LSLKIPAATAKITNDVAARVQAKEIETGKAVGGTELAVEVRTEVDRYMKAAGLQATPDMVKKLQTAVADSLVTRLEKMASAGEAKVAQTIVKYNLRELASPEAIADVARQVFGDAKYCMATAGYSDAKLSAEAQYPERMPPLFDNMSKMLMQVAFGSSPTASEGSVDALTTIAAQNANAPILYQTAAGYIPYIVVDSFPESVDKDKFLAAPKFFYASGDAYSKGMAIGSNCALISGGGDVTVKDFLNQLTENHPVVLFDDGRGDKWNEGRARPDNGSAWLAQLVRNFQAGEPLDERLFTRAKGALSLPGATGPYQPGDLQKFMDSNKVYITERVKIVAFHAPEDARRAADDTTAFLKRSIADIFFFAASHLNMDAGARVVSNAQKFVIPVPKLEGLAPVDKSGGQIKDYEGKARTGEGFVWYNAVDKAAQFVPTDGTGVIIMNEVTEENAKKVQAKIAELTGKPGGDPAQLTLADFDKLMSYVIHDLGIKDCYDSNTKFIGDKMNAMEKSRTGIPHYGLHRRDDRDICQAIFVSAQEGAKANEFAGPAFTPQQFGDDGAVILRQGKDVRLIQRDVFFRTYAQVDGSALSSKDIPQQIPNV